VGRAVITKVFQSRETMGVVDVGVEESDINSHHDGAGAEAWGETE
jgi:hypothetical protein